MRTLLRSQRRWAKAAGLSFDAHGYLSTVEANLFEPFTASLREDFARGAGVELAETQLRPARMRALHSSAVLAINVFGHFAHANARPLLAALGIDDTLAHPLYFEAQAHYPSGLVGHPPNVDVALELASGAFVGIESKFTEWLTRKNASKAAMKVKYFADGAAWWRAAGLPQCQRLADDIDRARTRFRLLDAAQLLKHALGLATGRPGRFSLLYIYFDVTGPASAAHRAEIAQFAARAGNETGFRALSYQTLYRALRARDDVDASYLRYLGTRYFE